MRSRRSTYALIALVPATLLFVARAAEVAAQTIPMSGLAASTTFLAQAPPPSQPPAGQPPAAHPADAHDVDMDMHETSGWPVSPVWLGIGAVLLIAVIALVVASSRGGSTTVVKD